MFTKTSTQFDFPNTKNTYTQIDISKIRTESWRRYRQNGQCGNGKHGGGWAEGRTESCNSCTSSVLFELLSPSTERRIFRHAAFPIQDLTTACFWGWFEEFRLQSDDWRKNLPLASKNLDLFASPLQLEQQILFLGSGCYRFYSGFGDGDLGIQI